MAKQEFDRQLLSMRYSGLGRRINQALRAMAPWAWQFLRDIALRGHEPRRPAPKVTLSGRWHLWREKRRDVFKTCSRQAWQNAFRKHLR